MTHSVPIEKTDLVGVPLVGTRLRLRLRRGKPKKGENKMTILKEKIEDIIEKICAEVSVSVANLRAGRRGRKYTVARRRIAERLIANYGMTQRKIGELTGVPNQAIASPKATQGMPCIAKGYAWQEKTTGAVDILHKRYIGDDPERKASLRDERKKAEPKTENTVTIDFSGRKELLNHLEKYAGEETRSVEDQIMCFIQNQLSFEEAEADGNQG